MEIIPMESFVGPNRTKKGNSKLKVPFDTTTYTAQCAGRKMFTNRKYNSRTRQMKNESIQRNSNKIVITKLYRWLQTIYRKGKNPQTNEMK